MQIIEVNNLSSLMILTKGQFGRAVAFKIWEAAAARRSCPHIASQKPPKKAKTLKAKLPFGNHTGYMVASAL